MRRGSSRTLARQGCELLEVRGTVKEFNMRPSGIFCAVVFALSFVPSGAALQTQTTNAAGVFDVILRNGSILDGTGTRPYRADLGISSGTIAKIGDLRAERAVVDLDVAGLFVAPGFINLHSHATANALPRAENMLTQGVTTEILNPDGGGPVDIAEQMAQLAAPGLALNIGVYVGFNSVWRTVVGSEDHPPTAQEVNRMRGMVVAGLEHGAWGVSAGLDYTPALYAKTADVIQVVEAARNWRTNFPNHERLTSESNFSSRVGITETIAIAEAAGLVPVITHMKAQGLEQGTAPALVARMARATRSGHYTAADVYPYLAGQTGLGALLIPGWAQDGGREEMLKRFTDAATARRHHEGAERLSWRSRGPHPRRGERTGDSAVRGRK
jgi:N-acyl-D-aspartate/D-glutamate deacylase